MYHFPYITKAKITDNTVICREKDITSLN